MSQHIAGPAALALASLSPSQINFLQSLPKAELHAHLNGSIPLSCLQELAAQHASGSQATEFQSDLIRDGIDKLQKGVDLVEIHDFFKLFPAIYALTSTPDALAFATRAVLREFLDGENPQCSYLEIRTTPRRNENMTRRQYIEAVLAEVEKYDSDQAALIVSLDRRMGTEDAAECVDVAIDLRHQGRRVVGIDLCGDPMAGNMAEFETHFRRARESGLGITLHIAETAANSSVDTSQLLSFQPQRLGHATFLDEAAKKVVSDKRICVEICLTSNILCKTVPLLDDHHIVELLKNGHPIAICTDDILPFRNSLIGEYALLLAQPPLGLGVTEDKVQKLAEMSLQNRFK
ncbi:Metallo-dependent hydrolase [Rickenella mellea]|uniref:Metallo-dependent hydrolase n=1 Tax=Rickenella mellea TaxID=50990 RepID=A0A4Y7QF35_9AGAM|nr:Metallo-dependent hydrolase [Rickenella mellea]